MEINKVVDYVLHTPFNTNKAILIGMLEQLITSHGGSLDEEPEIPDIPDVPGKEIIYDGGMEQ